MSRREDQSKNRADWLATGAALTKDSPDAATRKSRRRSQLLSVSVGIDPAPIGNAVYDALCEIALAFGREPTLADPIRLVLAEMIRLELAGPDWRVRVEYFDDRAMQNAADVAAAVHVWQHQHAGLSQEAAIERAMVDLAIASSTYGGANREMKRRLKRVRETSSGTQITAALRATKRTKKTKSVKL